MDTTAQNQSSSSGSVQQGQPVTPVQNLPFAQAQGKQAVQLNQPMPVNPAGKETPPMPSSQQEWIATPVEVTIPQEAKEVGAESAPTEALKVSPDVAAQGVAPTGLAASIPTEPILKFPMTEEKAEGILKMHKKVKDSIYWLAMLIVRQFKMLKVQKKSPVSGEVVSDVTPVSVQPDEKKSDVVNPTGVTPTGVKEAA